MTMAFIILLFKTIMIRCHATSRQWPAGHRNCFASFLIQNQRNVFRWFTHLNFFVIFGQPEKCLDTIQCGLQTLRFSAIFGQHEKSLQATFKMWSQHMKVNIASTKLFIVLTVDSWISIKDAMWIKIIERYFFDAGLFIFPQFRKKHMLFIKCLNLEMINQRQYSFSK